MMLDIFIFSFSQIRFQVTGASNLLPCYIQCVLGISDGVQRHRTPHKYFFFRSYYTFQHQRAARTNKMFNSICIKMTLDLPDWIKIRLNRLKSIFDIVLSFILNSSISPIHISSSSVFSVSLMAIGPCGASHACGPAVCSVDANSDHRHISAINLELILFWRMDCEHHIVELMPHVEPCLVTSQLVIKWKILVCQHWILIGDYIKIWQNCALDLHVSERGAVYTMFN